MTAFLFLVGPTTLILFALRVIPAYRRLHPMVRILVVGPIVGPVITFLVLRQIATDPLHYMAVLLMLFGGMLIASAVEAIVWWVSRILQAKRDPLSN